MGITQLCLLRYEVHGEIRLPLDLSYRLVVFDEADYQASYLGGVAPVATHILRLS